MRSNTKLIVSYLVAAMIVNFFGGLTLRTMKMEQRRERLRNLGIPGPFTMFGRFIAVIFKLFFGLLGIIVGLLLFIILGPIKWLLCDKNQSCLLKEIRNGCFHMVVSSAKMIGKIPKKFFAETKDNGSGRNRLLSLRTSRLLSKAVPGVIDENFKVDCSAYKGDTPKEVLFEILKESFIENQKLQKLTREVNFMELFLRQGFRLTPTDVVKDTERLAMWKEAEKNIKFIFDRKPVLFQLRINRMICGASKPFLDKLDLLVNPERWTGNDKKNYDKLILDIKGSDAKKKAEANKKMDEIFAKFDSENQDFQNKVAKILMDELKAYGLTKQELKSDYVMGVLKTVLADAANKKTGAAKGAATQVADLNFSEVDQELKGAEKIELPNDSTKVANQPQMEDEEVDELEKAKAKETQEVQQRV